MTSINPFPAYMHSNMSSTGKPVDEISEFLLFTVTDGGHFGFCALENSARLFKRGVVAYFFTNTLSYLKQASNLTCRRFVTESGFWTLLLAHCVVHVMLKATELDLMHVIGRVGHLDHPHTQYLGQSHHYIVASILYTYRNTLFWWREILGFVFPGFRLI